MAFLQRLFVNLQAFDFDKENIINESDSSICYGIKAHPAEPDDKSESRSTIQKDPANTLYCAKISKQILTKAIEQEKLLHEVLILKNVNHPAILDFKGFNLYDFEHTPHPTIITLYMNNRSLYDVINGKAELDVTKKQICIIGIASAICHLHRLEIAHCNLKPSNVLLDDKFYPKVCDFGFKRKFSKDNYSVNIAPEMVDADLTHLKFDQIKSCDAYAFAILCYELITGKIPFDGLSNPKVYQSVKEGKPLSFGDSNISQKFKDLINECYNPDPSKRPNFESIYSRLIDDCSLVINDEVDLDVLSEYMKTLKDNTTEKGLRVLEICNYPGYAYEYYNETKIEYDTSDPNTLNDMVARNFEVEGDGASQMAFILKMYSTVSADYTAFAKATNFANYMLTKNDKSAKEFIRKAFGEVKFDNKDKIQQSDTKKLTAKLFNLNISGKVKTIGKLAFYKKNIQNINLLGSIESIESEAFKECKKLTFVNLNNDMTTISAQTFEGCKDLKYVLLSDKLLTIEEKAFKDCVSLEYIYIPPSVKTIKKKAFAGCKKLSVIEMSCKTTYDKKESFPPHAGKPKFYDKK